jgi:hypothetical protein
MKPHDTCFIEQLMVHYLHKEDVMRNTNPYRMHLGKRHLVWVKYSRKNCDIIFFTRYRDGQVTDFSTQVKRFLKILKSSRVWLDLPNSARKDTFVTNCEGDCLCLSTWWCFVSSAPSQPSLSFIAKVLHRRRSGHTWYNKNKARQGQWPVKRSHRWSITVNNRYNIYLYLLFLKMSFTSRIKLHYVHYVCWII